MLTLFSILVDANIFGQLFDNAFMTALKDIVETTVKNTLSHAVDDAVDKAVDKAMKNMMHEAVQTVDRKVSQAISKRFAVDKSLPRVTNSGDLNIVDDFSEYASDLIWPDRTCNIYCEREGMYRILGMDEKHELTLVSPERAKDRNFSSSFYEWKCQERDGFYSFYNR